MNTYLLTLEISAAVCTPVNKMRLEEQSALPLCTCHNICAPNFIKTTEPFVHLLQELIVEFKWRIDIALQKQYDCSDL